MTHAKEYLEKIIAEAQAGLQALEAEKWPKKEDGYFCSESNGRVSLSYWDNDDLDRARLDQGNVFRTQEAAEARVKWNRLHTAMMRASDEWVTGKEQYAPVWDRKGNEPEFTSWLWNYYANRPYFNTESACDKAVKEILGDDAEFYLTYDGGYK